MKNLFSQCIIIALFLGHFFNNSALADSASPGYESFYNVQFVGNYDGDTITFNIPNTPAIVGENMKIRVRRIDTPELKKNKCSAEKEKAETAKQVVYSLLAKARVINLHRIERGKYFRMLADVEFDGQDLATVLLEQNLAIRYSGGKRDFNWCQENKKEIQPKSYLKSTLPPKISGVYVWPPPPVANTVKDK